MRKTMNHSLIKINGILFLLMFLIVFLLSCKATSVPKDYLYIRNRLQLTAFRKICEITTNELKIARKKRGYVPRLEIAGIFIKNGELKMIFSINQYIIFHKNKIVVYKNNNETSYDAMFKYIIFEEESVRIVFSPCNKEDEHIFLKLSSDSTDKYSLINISFENSSDFIGNKGYLYSLPNWY